MKREDTNTWEKVSALVADDTRKGKKISKGNTKKKGKMNTMTLITLCAALAATGMWMRDKTPRI